MAGMGRKSDRPLSGGDCPKRTLLQEAGRGPKGLLPGEKGPVGFQPATGRKQTQDLLRQSIFTGPVVICVGVSRTTAALAKRCRPRHLSTVEVGL